MAELQSRLDFNFNGKWLSEFNATLYNSGNTEEINLLSSCKHKTQEIDGVNGAKYIGKNLEPRVEKLTIFFKGGVDKDMILNWLDTDEPKPFYYENDDRQLMCILNSAIDIGAEFINDECIGGIEIEMIAYEPYWTEIVPRYLDIQNPVKGQEYRIFYDGNEPSRPIIRLECVGEKTNIAIGFNEYEIEIDRFTQNLTIDMRYGAIYTELNGEQINKYSSYKLIGGYHEREMVDNEPCTHNVFRIIRGDVTRLKVTPNIRWK